MNAFSKNQTPNHYLGVASPMLCSVSFRKTTCKTSSCKVGTCF